MSDCKTVRLGDVATYINGYAFKPSDWGTEGLPIIRIQNLTGNDYETNFYNGKIPEKYFVKNGDVLISWSASLGVYEWKKNDALLNQHIFKVVFDKLEVDKKYFMFTVSNLLNAMSKQTHGSTMRHITKPDFDNMPFPLPPIEKQKQIARKLDKCNELILKNNRILEKYDLLIKSRFIEMFSSQKDSFPFCTLDTVSSRIFAGGDRPKETSETKNDEFQYPVFANAETNKGLLCYSKTYQVELPCVTIAARGCTVGYTEVRNEKFTPVVRLLTIIPSKEITPLFLKYYLDLEMKIEGNGAAQPQLTVPTVKKYQIYVPSLTLQNDFAAFVQQIDKSKFAVQKSLEKTETLYKSLMQEYFG